MESNNAHHQNFRRFVLCPNVSWVGHWIHPAVVALLGAHLTAAGFALILSVLMPALEEPMSALGHKRTNHPGPKSAVVRFNPKADKFCGAAK
jgi:hypothetical protein